MTPFTFYKISATGNDFIVVDNRKKEFDNFSKEKWEHLCNRRLGIGADGVLMLEKAKKKSNDYKMKYLNADGSEESMCGNGSRALLYFAHKILKLKKTTKYKFETKNGIYNGELLPNTHIKINMSELYDINKIKIDSLVPKNIKPLFSLYLNTGVPHSVYFVENNKEIDLINVAPKIRHNPIFPQGSNVNFASIIDEKEIDVRTFERGVENETLSCGTGVVACCIALKYFKNWWGKIKVKTKGGNLTVEFSEDLKSIYFIGPVDLIYKGKVYKNSLSY